MFPQGDTFADQNPFEVLPLRLTARNPAFSHRLAEAAGRSLTKAQKELRAHEFVTGNPSKGGDLEGRMRDWNRSKNREAADTEASEKIFRGPKKQRAAGGLQTAYLLNEPVFHQLIHRVVACLAGKIFLFG